MTRTTVVSAIRRAARLAAGAALVAALAPAPADAQIFRVGTTTPLISGGTLRGNDVGYDPVNQVYLVITDKAGAAGVYGVFVNTSGQAITSSFTVYDGSQGSASFVKATYSLDVNNGVGGTGGFLVAWNQWNGSSNGVAVRTVSFAAPGRVVSSVQMASAGEQLGSFAEALPAIAYSRTSRRFLVAWQTAQFGVIGRFVDTNGTPFGASMLLENAGGSRDPSLAWNPAADEFGLLASGWNSSSAFVSFRRIRASDGLVFGRATFGFSLGTFATALDVNAANQYVGAWGLGPGTRTVTFDASGNQLALNFITSRIGYNQAMGIAYNPSSGTFLAVSQDSASNEIAGVEISGGGAPNSSVQILTNGGGTGGSFYPHAAAQAGAPNWSVSYSRQYAEAANQIISTTSTGGGTGGGAAAGGGGTTTGTCTGTDPFASIGGGTCVNGGWVPNTGGTTTGTGGTTTTGGCTTPDPFAAIGGGTCVNGGWVPGTTSGSGGTTTTGGCTTPDPFAAIGGGHCVNGGWLPGTTTGTGGTTTTGGCTTPDPFVSIGGGHCVNGGWLPGATTGTGGTTTTGGCTTPDPFASIGGGHCVNGGWLPGLAPGTTTTNTGGCTTPDPFVSIGGGHCVNGGWLPGTVTTTTASSCTTPDPFASIGGGVCVNGGWVPRTSTSTCTTPDPFTSIGGGVCINGGWVPIGGNDDDD